MDCLHSQKESLIGCQNLLTFAKNFQTNLKICDTIHSMNKILTTTLLLIATSVSAKTVLVDYPIPITSLSVEINKSVESLTMLDRRMQATKTIDAAMSDCNNELLRKQLTNKISRTYKKLSREVLASPSRAAGYDIIVNYYISRSNNPNRVIDKRAPGYVNMLFTTNSFRQYTMSDMDLFKQEEKTPVVSLITPYTLLCQGVFSVKSGEKVLVRFDITRNPATNEKTYIGTDEIEPGDTKIVENIVRITQHEANFPKVFNSLLLYHRNQCTRDCFNKEQLDVAVDFLLGEATVKQAIDAGLLIK
jgi:hypothetical protein